MMPQNSAKRTLLTSRESIEDNLWNVQFVKYRNVVIMLDQYICDGLS
jgi:hypothetical protein